MLLVPTEQDAAKAPEPGRMLRRKEKPMLKSGMKL
jgi:hypothetical protein